MNGPFLSLATSTWDDAEVKAIHEVIASDKYTMGEKVKKYEELFASYIGSKYAVMSNSGSSANLLMIAALRYHSKWNLVPGDEVIVPAVSWGTTYFPLQQYGLKVKFVDININTLNINIAALREAITEKTKAIFVVNLLGNPNNFDDIKEICGAHSLFFIEDNCESLGAEFNSQKTGTFGVMGSFSSFFSHHISTMEGGITVTNDEELYHLLLSLRAHGWTRNLPKINKICNLSEDPFIESFRFILPGYNLRPLEMSGAIGIEQLAKLPALIHKRQANGAYFTNLFNSSKKFLTQKQVGSSSWFGFSLVLRQDLSMLMPELRSILEEINVEYRPIVTGNFLNSDVIKYFDYEIHSNLANAEYIDKFGLFIGNHHYDISDKLDFIADKLEQLQ